MSLETRKIVRFVKGEKVEIEAVPTKFDANRAEEILQKTSFANFDKQMTDGEIAYTHQIWDIMPGHTSFYDALCRIYQNRV